jgi:hypothetical protein
MKWFRSDQQEERIMELEKQLKALQSPPPATPTPKDSERLAEVEVKIAKLWNLLREETNLGKDKLTKHGRIFKEKIKADEEIEEKEEEKASNTQILIPV